MGDYYSPTRESLRKMGTEMSWEIADSPATPGQPGDRDTFTRDGVVVEVVYTRSGQITGAGRRKGSTHRGDATGRGKRAQVESWFRETGPEDDTTPAPGPGPRHRTTYHSARLTPSDVTRYRDPHDNQLVVQSLHGSLTDVSATPCAHAVPKGRVAGQVAVHRCTAPDGTPGYVLVRHTDGHQLVRHRQGADDQGHKVDYYLPASQWFTAGGYLYPTLTDALIAAGDDVNLAIEEDRLADMTATATAAAATAAGTATPTGDHPTPPRTPLSRAAYLAACASVGLHPADDADTLVFASYTLPETRAEHILWVQLTRARHLGVQAEKHAGHVQAVTAANRAAGPGPYDRDAYETACAAAGVTPLTDDALPDALADYTARMDHAAGFPVPDTTALGPGPHTGALLGHRRMTGLAQWMQQIRDAKRAGLLAQAHVFATPHQVEEILRLLARHDGSGPLIGPTDRAVVELLSPAQATAYLSSLKQSAD